MTTDLAIKPSYSRTLSDVSRLLEAARAVSARTLNAVMTTTYFSIGRRIVEEEQAGRDRAGYGMQLIEKLAVDLKKRFGRGYGSRNLMLMRAFYLEHRDIPQTVSAESAFPLPWSHYSRLLSVSSENARRFYEHEALHGGWTHRQLDRQIQSQFYERTLASKNKAAMLKKGRAGKDTVVPEELLREPYLLEFLGMKDEHSESDLESALIARLEGFLLELGSDFTFVGRQKRLRIGDEWYRVDLLMFHRRLRCLVVIDLKLGKFSHADAGQMQVYVSYARQHWMQPFENPPIGLILCSQADASLAHYALEGLPNAVIAAEYRTVLPDEKLLVQQLEKTQAELRVNQLTALPA